MRDALVTSPNRQRLKAARTVSNVAQMQMDDALSISTFYDTLPYQRGHAKYRVIGPLQLIFNHFAALDNRTKAQELRRASRSFHEIEYGTTTMSAQELLYFCSRFKLLSKRRLKWKEVQMVYQNSCGYAEKLRRSGVEIPKALKTQLPGLVKKRHCFQYQSCSSQLSAHEFVVVLARFSQILFPLLALPWKWRHLKHKTKVSDIEKWNVFVDVFRLAEMKFIKRVLRKSTVTKNARVSAISFAYHGHGPRQSLGLLRMGFAREVGERIGRNAADDAQYGRGSFEPLSIALLNAGKQMLFKAPSRDWRRFDAEFINFGQLLRERFVRYDALIEITNVGPEMRPKWLSAALCRDTPRFVTLRGQRRVHLYFGIKWKLLVHIDRKDATSKEHEIGFTFSVLLFQGKSKRMRRLIAKIPVFVEIQGSKGAPKRKATLLPCLKAIDWVNRIRFEYKSESRTRSRSRSGSTSKHSSCCAQI